MVIFTDKKKTDLANALSSVGGINLNAISDIYLVLCYEINYV